MIFKILIVIGMILSGYIAPEILIEHKPALRIPLGMNVISAIAWGLISTGVLFGFGL